MHSAPDEIYEREIQDDNKIAANWLLWIAERKNDYLQKRCEILNSENHELQLAVPSNRTGTSDPAGVRGTKLAELQEAERWIKLIAEVEERLPWRKKIFLQLRREYRFSSGRNGWTAAVQYRYNQRISEILNVRPEEIGIDSRQTLNIWWHEIIDYTVRLACKRGLLIETNNEKAG